ncbi:molybdenum cofactor guanylyltransferase MobA [Pseudomonas sp. F1_0610]|uniref:molybdenum cofactor guanylyltransferase MobA n=1 Tax=Pseudomonas sp. F1_0610 TaxID=3114284 RepID=UPI0039C3F8FE
MPNAPIFTNCSIVVLAGGQGQRMGGQDKGWMLWKNRALIEHIYAVVRPLTDDLIISCNRNFERYAQLADRIVTDPDNSFSGPLTGIISGLSAARHDYVIFLPCDAPCIDSALLEQLYQQVQSSAVMLRQQGFYQPLFSAVQRSSLADLQAQWVAGERRPRIALQQIGANALECADDDPRLANFNEPAVLEQFS